MQRRNANGPDSLDEKNLPVDAEPQQHEQAAAESPLYSVFSRRDKVAIVCLVAIAGFFSPFTAFIYFPSLRSIANEFHVSIELMNVTVTFYLLVQGVVPTDLGRHFRQHRTETSLPNDLYDLLRCKHGASPTARLCRAAHSPDGPKRWKL